MAAELGRKERRQKWWAKQVKTDSKAVGGGSDETERGKQACLNTGKDNVLKHAHSKKQQTLASPAPASANSAGFRSSMQRPLGGTTNIRKRNIQPSPSTGTHTTTNTLTRPPKTSRSAEETITHSDVDSEADTTAETVTEESSGRRRSGKRRYIAFVGNLPFSATTEEVVQHFAKRGVRVTEARLLTRRESDQSRGCCFTEFPNSKTLQNALKFHHTVMDGRRINVEVTCGGGGKGSRRMSKIRERNERVRKARQKRVKTRNQEKS